LAEQPAPALVPLTHTLDLTELLTRSVLCSTTVASFVLRFLDVVPEGEVYDNNDNNDDSC
jgi:hypothetical protein